MRPNGQRRTTGHPSDQALYFFSPSPLRPPLASIKGRGEQTSQGLDLLQIEHHSKGLGSDALSRPVRNPTTNTPTSGTRQLDTGHRVLLLGGPNQYKYRCLLR
jgi:hypothetical protein